MQLPRHCASRYLQNPIQQIVIVQFRFHDAGKLNLDRRHEYQMTLQDMHAPSLSTPSANPDDRLPMELAMMDLQLLQLSRARSHVDLFCRLNPHLQQIADHLTSDLKE